MKVSLLFLALLVLAGCGMIAHGTSQHIRCTTVPSGAVVSTSDGTTCSTPCTITLKRKKDDFVTFRREGYDTVSLPIHAVISTNSAGNILLPGGLVCWGVDLASGGAYHLEPASVDLNLTPDAGKSGPRPPG